jgi:glycine dehydrogenase subunit 2
MIEPTEVESKQTLDRFIATMIEIAKLAEKTPKTIRNAPISLSLKRLDEVKAAREPNLRWEKQK